MSPTPKKYFQLQRFLTVGQVRETNKCFYLSPITGNIGKCIKMVLLFTTNTNNLNCRQNNNESYDNVTLCLLVVIILN